MQCCKFLEHFLQLVRQIVDASCGGIVVDVRDARLGLYKEPASRPRSYGITNSTGARGPSGSPKNTQTTVKSNPPKSRNTE